MKHFWIFGWLVQIHWAKSWNDRITITNDQGYKTRILFGAMHTEPKDIDVTPVYRLVLWRLMIETGTTISNESNHV